MTNLPGSNSDSFFRLERKAGCLIFSLINQVNTSNQDAFKKAFEDQINAENPGAIFIIPQATNTLSPSLLRSIAPTAVYFRDHNLQTYFVTSDPSEIEFLKNSGLGNTFQIVPGVETILSASAPRLDVNFINPFVDGTVQSLQKLASLKARPGKSFMKSAEHPMPQKTDIAAVIGLVSKHFRGSVAICFENAVIAPIAERILEKPKIDLKETTDLETALSQLMGHLFYTAAIGLGDHGYGFEQAVPTVVKGKTLEVMHLAPTPTLVLPFTTELGPFWMEITVTR